jgi:Zn-dependent M28 family amino/carboxypeptidase
LFLFNSGSGTAAILVIATNLARLYQSGNYAKYRYRVRFCWWGAEEIGLAGAIYHVQQAQNTSSTAGNRLQDYLINLNYDMLGSSNYFFGIYNGSSAKADTPPQALNGSIRISETFRDWFNEQKLPWDYTDFSGRSDYGPFLAAGVVAGGLFSGADETKTRDQRLKYEAGLGQGQGGLAGAISDPCYHQSCDTNDNINQFAYVRMVQAAAYILEHIGRMDNLAAWLYPNGRSQARLPDNYFPKSDYF